MRNRLFLFCLFLVMASIANAQCDVKQYTRIFSEAEALQGQGQFIEAKNKYEAAKIYACGAKDLDQADKAVDGLFEQIEQLRTKADSAADINKKQALNNYVSDLIYKSQIALDRGDRNSAFRLAEFAHQFVQEDNPDVLGALLKVYYYNDNPIHKQLPSVLNLEGHTDEVSALALSPNGKVLATGSKDNTIRLWDTKTGEILNSLKIHNGEVNCLVFSPDGEALASCAYYSNTVVYWDIRHAKKNDIQLSDNNNPIALSFPKNSKILVIGCKNGAVISWDIQTEKVVKRVKIHDTWGNITSIDFSPNGRMLVESNNYDSPKIIDLKTGNIIKSLKDSPFSDFGRSINCIAYSPDGKVLAAGIHNTIKIWDIEKGSVLFNLEGHTKIIKTVGFSSDGEKLVTGSEDNTAKIWDIKTGKEIITLSGHVGSVLCSDFSPGGDTIFTGSEDKTVKIWNIQTGSVLRTLDTRIEGLFSKLILADESPSSALDSFNNNFDINKVVNGADDIMLGRVTSVAISLNSKQVATGSDDRTIKIWDIQSGKLKKILNGHKGPIYSVAFSPDGKTLVSGSEDYSVKIWNIQNGEILVNFEASDTIADNYITDVNYSPDGNLLAIGFKNKTAKIWNLNEMKIGAILPGQPNNNYLDSIGEHLNKKIITDSFQMKINNLYKRIKSFHALMNQFSGKSNVVFSPDNKTIATTPSDNTIVIWDVQSGKAIDSFQNGQDESITCVAFSPDGKTIALGSDKKAKIWDIQSGKTIATYVGHQDRINSITYSPDGKIVATGSFDHSAKLWDVQSGKLINTLESHTNSVMAVAFSPDGRRLATGSYDQATKIWELNADTIIQQWLGFGTQADLILPQLQQFNLETLLDQHPNNEQKLIATQETWQIKAFADLAASQAEGSNILDRVEPHYARADRLYAAALALQNELLIRMDYAKMLRRWAEVCKSDGLESRAAELNTKADGLWKETGN